MPNDHFSWHRGTGQWSDEPVIRYSIDNARYR
jgi:hypothetical protein